MTVGRLERHLDLAELVVRVGVLEREADEALDDGAQSPRSSEAIAADAAKAASTADTIDDAPASLRTVTFTLDNERDGSGPTLGRARGSDGQTFSGGTFGYAQRDPSRREGYARDLRGRGRLCASVVQDGLSGEESPRLRGEAGVRPPARYSWVGGRRTDDRPGCGWVNATGPRWTVAATATPSPEVRWFAPSTSEMARGPTRSPRRRRNIAGRRFARGERSRAASRRIFSHNRRADARESVTPPKGNGGKWTSSRISRPGPSSCWGRPCCS